MKRICKETAGLPCCLWKNIAIIIICYCIVRKPEVRKVDLKYLGWKFEGM